MSFPQYGVFTYFVYMAHVLETLLGLLLKLVLIGMVFFSIRLNGDKVVNKITNWFIFLSPDLCQWLNHRFFYNNMYKILPSQPCPVLVSWLTNRSICVCVIMYSKWKWKFRRANTCFHVNAINTHRKTRITTKFYFRHFLSKKCPAKKKQWGILFS